MLKLHRGYNFQRWFNPKGLGEDHHSVHVVWVCLGNRRAFGFLFRQWWCGAEQPLWRFPLLTTTFQVSIQTNHPITFFSSFGVVEFRSCCFPHAFVVEGSFCLFYYLILLKGLLVLSYLSFKQNEGLVIGLRSVNCQWIGNNDLSFSCAILYICLQRYLINNNISEYLVFNRAK